MRRREGVLDGFLIGHVTDNQLYYVESRAIRRNARTLEMRSKGRNRGRKSMKYRFRDLAGHDVACQVLPHPVLVIPTPKTVGTNEKSGVVIK